MRHCITWKESTTDTALGKYFLQDLNKGYTYLKLDT